MDSLLFPIIDIFQKEHITQIGCIPLTEKLIINSSSLPENCKNVIVILAPYDTGTSYQDGVSAYAHTLDYHLYFRSLYQTVLPQIQSVYPDYHFYGFADISPVNEKLCAGLAGLGELGLHSLLINPTYGTYVFIGTILTDLPVQCSEQPLFYCPQCGLCMTYCPGSAIYQNGIHPGNCLSALSQEKHLTGEQLALLKSYHIAWGCDRCQEVCPENRSRKYTPIPFFQTERIQNYTSQFVISLPKKEFLNYAFSWRGRKRIVENLQNLERNEE